MRCWCLLFRSLIWICGVYFFLILFFQEVLFCLKVGFCFRGFFLGSFQILLDLDIQRIDLRFFFFVYLGFGDRLLSEVKKLVSKDVKIRVGVCWGLGLGVIGFLRVWSVYGMVFFLVLFKFFGQLSLYRYCQMVFCFYVYFEVCQKGGFIFIFFFYKRRVCLIFRCGRVLGLGFYMWFFRGINNDRRLVFIVFL